MRQVNNLIFCLIMGAGGCSFSEIGSMDSVPAATLLLPYFQVKTTSGSDYTTLFTVRNVSDSPVIAQVSLWTNCGIASVAFNLHLAAHAQQDVNLKDIFEGATLFDPPVDFSTIAPTLVSAHSGYPDPTSGKCSSLNTNFPGMVGYVLINAVNEASELMPYETGYFAQGGTGIASNKNVLWGDFEIIDAENNYEFGETLVCIEASSTHPLVTQTGAFTFYSRFVGMTAADNREPLPLLWVVNFSDAGGTGKTDLIYWRDSMNVMSPFTCGASPIWFPLMQERMDIYDGMGNVTTAEMNFPFSKECGRVEVGGLYFPVPYFSGWLNLDLSIPNSPVTPSSQALIMSIKTSDGIFETGTIAIPLAPLVQP